MQNTVRNTIRIATLSALFAVGSGAASALHAAESGRAAGSAPDRAEKRQMTEDFSPKAQYRRSMKEAHAAYADALKNCKTMSKGERAACRQEAKQNLQSDLAYAKDQMKSGENYGSSGMQEIHSGGSAAGGPARSGGHGASGPAHRPGY